jgi:transposase InsO family protein
VADFTHVWTLRGFCYTAFCVDVFSRRILGWRVLTSKATALVTSVLEQALFTRRYAEFHFTATGLVHHSDAGWSVHVDRVHRGAARGRDRRVDRQRRRRLGQCVDGIRCRTV